MLWGQGAGAIGTTTTANTSAPGNGATISPATNATSYYLSNASLLATLTYNLPILGLGVCHDILSLGGVTTLTLGTANYSAVAGVSSGALTSLAANTNYRFCQAGTTIVRVQ